jgi:hypothetical protein
MSGHEITPSTWILDFGPDHMAQRHLQCVARQSSLDILANSGSRAQVSKPLGAVLSIRDTGHLPNQGSRFESYYLPITHKYNGA